MTIIIYYMLPAITMGMLALYWAARRRHPDRKGRSALLLAGALLIPSLLFMGLVATDPSDNLVITSAALAPDPDGRQVLRGTVLNRTEEESFTDVRVEIELLDSDDGEIGSAVATRDRLEPGESWTFMVPAELSGAVDFRARVSSPDNRRF